MLMAYNARTKQKKCLISLTLPIERERESVGAFNVEIPTPMHIPKTTETLYDSCTNSNAPTLSSHHGGWRNRSRGLRDEMEIETVYVDTV